MFKRIALATITAAALVALPSLVYAQIKLNGSDLNGLGQNGIAVNSTAGGENSTVLTIELPQGHVGR